MFKVYKKREIHFNKLLKKSNSSRKVQCDKSIFDLFIFLVIKLLSKDKVFYKHITYGIILML